MNMMFEDLDDILNVATLTEVLGMSKNTVLKLLASGELPGKKIGREWRILKSELIKSLK